MLLIGISGSETARVSQCSLFRQKMEEWCPGAGHQNALRPMPYLVSLSRRISPTANALFRLQAQRCACRVPQARLRHRRPQNAAGCVASNSQLRYQLGVVFDYLGFAPNLDTLPVGIVHPGLLSTRRFSIAIATDQQISKTDRTQTADTLRSLDAFS